MIFRKPMTKSTYARGSNSRRAEQEISELKDYCEPRIKRLNDFILSKASGTVSGDSLLDAKSGDSIWQDPQVRKYVNSTMRENTMRINMIHDAPGTVLAEYLSSCLWCPDILIKQGRAAVGAKYPYSCDGEGNLLEGDDLLDGILKSLDISGRESFKPVIKTIIDTCSKLDLMRKGAVAWNFIKSANSDAFDMPTDVIGSEAITFQKQLIDQQEDLWRISEAMYSGDCKVTDEDDPITLGRKARERWYTDIAHCADKNKTTEMLANSILRLERQGVDPSLISCVLTKDQLENLRDADEEYKEAWTFTEKERSAIMSKKRPGWVW